MLRGMIPALRLTGIAARACCLAECINYCYGNNPPLPACNR
jgi:hypothetical protein